MINMPLSTKLQRRIAKEMAEGKYRSPEDMMVQALDALADRRGAIEAITRGLADAKAGRVRSWRHCKRELLKRMPHRAAE
jgi:predicted transcriptional regulator